MKHTRLNNTTMLSTVIVSVLVTTGCSTFPDRSEPATDTSDILIEKDRKISELESALQQERTARLSLQQKHTAVGPVQQQAAQGPLTGEDLLPPDARAGQCFARVFTPPRYKTETVTVLKKDASQRIEIVPARYETQEERVLIREASERIEIVPAQYEWVTEQVLVEPASERIEEVPAVYRTEYEKVLDKPEHTVWQKGTGPITKIDEATGEILCLVTIPATYKTVKKRVLVREATTQVIAVQASYKTIKKRVVKAPATTRKVTVPAEYKIIKTRKLLEPARTRVIPIEAEYTTVTRRSKVAEEKMTWAPVLCKTNMTSQIVSDLQKALGANGFSPGPVDGIIGPKTMSAVHAYQKAKGLSSGGLTMETLKALGVELSG